MSVEITGPGLPPAAALLERHMAIATATMQEAVLATEREWKHRAERSRRTGTYLRSITSLVQREGMRVVGQVGTNLPYARFLEVGTGLYGPRNQRIVPRHARALRWPAGGGQTFRGSTGAYSGFVNAPGFRATGEQRSGAAGRPASYVFARSVRGIMPRRYARDAAMVVRPRVEELFRAAGLKMARALVGVR